MSEVIKGVGTLHTPTYEIHGDERRKLKKEYNLLKSFVKNHAYVTGVNNDMYAFYGEHDKIINEEKQKEVIEKAKVDMTRIKEQLDKPYEIK